MEVLLTVKTAGIVNDTILLWIDQNYDAEKHLGLIRPANTNLTVFNQSLLLYTRSLLNCAQIVIHRYVLHQLRRAAFGDRYVDVAIFRLIAFYAMEDVLAQPPVQAHIRHRNFSRLPFA